MFFPSGPCTTKKLPVTQCHPADRCNHLGTPLKPTMNQLTYIMNQDENNYNQITNNRYYNDEYYDQYYDFDCDDQQYEYEDAMGRPYLDSAIPTPSIFYVANRVAKQIKAMRQEEKIRKLKAAAIKARQAAHEAAVFAAEVRARKEDFKNEQLSFFRSQLERQTLDEVAKAVYDKIYTDATEVKIANEVLLSKLPKFSSAQLAKMKAAENAKPEADGRFYTWRKGVTASNTSRNAWGHRRNGGGKGHKATLQEMNSEALAVERAAARRIRRKTQDVKEEEEETERSITIARVNAQRAALEAKKAAELEALKPEVEVVEETEGQKFKRLEIEAFRVKIATTEYVTDKIVEVKGDVEGWTKVDTKETKNTKIAKQIAKALYTAPRESAVDAVAVAAAVAPKPMSKKVTSTQMCKSVAKGTKCPYPPGKCNFAHCYDELKPKNCANRCCHFAKRIGDKYVNKGKKICTYIHEGETKSNLCQRIGVRVPDVILAPINITASIKIAGITPMSDRVLRPYSATRAWAPLDRPSRWGARKD